MSACSSCGAPITWAKTVNGKMIPLDSEPAERPTGLFTLRSDRGELFADSAAGTPVYISHFATCPNADAHRKT